MKQLMALNSIHPSSSSKGLFSTSKYAVISTEKDTEFRARSSEREGTLGKRHLMLTDWLVYSGNRLPLCNGHTSRTVFATNCKRKSSEI